MKNKVIGITGKARSGKDTISDYIREEDLNVVSYAFANPLKDAVSKLFDIPREDLDGDNREEILPEFGLSIRQILQRFGTESMRNVFDTDFWINKAKRSINKIVEEYPNIKIVISDVRFENEADFCRENGILIHVSKPDADGNVGDLGHASENGVQFQIGDYHISNDGSPEDLYNKIDVLLETL